MIEVHKPISTLGCEDTYAKTGRSAAVEVLEWYVRIVVTLQSNIAVIININL